MPSLFTTSDGSHTVLADENGLTYHSIFGAIAESQCVFLEAGLFPFFEKSDAVAVLETGFGTGLNAFMSYLEAEKQHKHVSFTTLELFPLEQDFVAQLNYAAQLGSPSQQAIFMQLHSCAWEKPIQISKYFTFEKKKIDISDFAKENSFDVVYYDAFAPTAQPELWTEAVFSHFYQSLKLGGTLVSYCAKGDIKRALIAAGFSIERLDGPPRKVEMTRAVKDLKQKTRDLRTRFKAQNPLPKSNFS